MLDVTHYLIGSALAAPAATTPVVPASAAGPDIMGPQAFVFVIILVLFYMLILRPQQQRLTQQEATLKKLQKGDHVVTAGGIHGIIYSLEDDAHVMVEIADNVRVKIVRSTISSVIKPETPPKK